MGRVLLESAADQSRIARGGSVGGGLEGESEEAAAGQSRDHEAVGVALSRAHRAVARVVEGEDAVGGLVQPVEAGAAVQVPPGRPKFGWKGMP